MFFFFLTVIMMRYYLLALGCVVLSQAVVGSRPDFCNIECPEFDSVRTTDDYEVRKYRDTTWVSTKVSSVNFGLASSSAFQKLFAYIRGENEAGVDIDMTQPVLVKIPEETTWWLWKEYTVSFMLPQEHWSNPPRPSNTDVYVEVMPQMTVYVKSYGGWADGWSTDSHRQEVEQKLTEEGRTFEDNFYFSAAYNGPNVMTNRRNEVWVLRN
ncbi:heme-binding protein 2-like [Branchiostoma lanceolatum]|uniref:heme-binding protein 2-like n=1 Tax=Branchiostoma lanceolatum TaxID=7740 RepID=UPI003451C392